MSVSAFNHVYTPEESHYFIDQDPEEFVKGVFSVPAEISSWSEVEDTPEEIQAMSEAFWTGRVYASNWAMKNARVKIQEVKGE